MPHFPNILNHQETIFCCSGDGGEIVNFLLIIMKPFFYQSFYFIFKIGKLNFINKIYIFSEAVSI